MRGVGLLLVAMTLHGAELRIDHVTVAGRSLGAMEAQLADTGVKVQAGGPHSNHATEMAIASFPDGSYLELIALQTSFDAQKLAQHSWKAFIEGDAGPCAWAVRPKNFDAEVARLTAAKIEVNEVNGGRQRLDGVSLEWQTAGLGTEGTGVFLPFLIHDSTPRDKRAFPTGKPANRDQSGVLRVVIAVNKIPDAVDRFRSAYPDTGRPLKEIDRKFGAEVAWLADTPVIFAAPLGSSSWVAERIAKFGEGPCAFILSTKKELKRGAAIHSRWFGRDIAWFDPQKLGWWLGVQQE